jgi:quercetin dioxygenase-like cupin family protein
MADNELDIRQLRKPDKHPHAEFDADLPGSYGWEYVEKGPLVGRIRISKLTSTPLPRILANTNDLTAGADAEPDATGAVWKLQARERDLDANVIALPPGGGIDSHAGPGLDVLIHVLSGSGRLTTETDTIELSPGALLWLPRRSRRQFTAGPEGLRYLTVHRRRQALVLEPPARQAV